MSREFATVWGLGCRVSGLGFRLWTLKVHPVGQTLTIEQSSDKKNLGKPKTRHHLISPSGLLKSQTPSDHTLENRIINPPLNPLTAKLPPGVAPGAHPASQKPELRKSAP